jgi:hypothetical protein
MSGFNRGILDIVLTLKVDINLSRVSVVRKQEGFMYKKVKRHWKVVHTRKPSIARGLGKGLLPPPLWILIGRKHKGGGGQQSTMDHYKWCNWQKVEPKERREIEAGS